MELKASGRVSPVLVFEAQTKRGTRYSQRVLVVITGLVPWLSGKLKIWVFCDGVEKTEEPLAT